MSVTIPSAPAARQAETRRRVIVSRPGTIEIIDDAAIEPAPNEALISMLVSGVCGSDLHAAQGKHPMVPLPYFPGHEVVGVVQAVGTDVTGIAPGMRVTPEPTLICGECKPCRTGRENICERLRFFGCGYSEGGMADTFTIPAQRLHVVPDDLTDRGASCQYARQMIPACLI